MSLHRPQSEEALGRLDDYEQRVDLFAEQARDYWRLWGPLGEHMVRGIDGWANQQHSYLRWLRHNHGEGHHHQTGETPDQRLPPPR